MYALLSLAALAIPAFAAPANDTGSGSGSGSNDTNALADLVKPMPNCFFLCADDGLKGSNCTSISDIGCMCDHILSVLIDMDPCVKSKCKDAQQQYGE